MADEPIKDAKAEKEPMDPAMKKKVIIASAVGGVVLVGLIGGGIALGLSNQKKNELLSQTTDVEAIKELDNPGTSSNPGNASGGDIALIQVQLQELSGTLDNMESTVSTSQTTINTMNRNTTTAMTDLMDKVDVIYAYYAPTEGEDEEDDEEVTDAPVQNEDLLEEIELLQKMLKDIHDSGVPISQEQLAAITASTTNINREVSVQGGAGDAQGAIDGMNIAVATLETSLSTDLQTLNTNVTSQLSGISAQITTAQDDIYALQQDISNSSITYAEMLDRLEAIDKSVSELQTDYNTIASDLTQKLDELSGSESSHYSTYIAQLSSISNQIDQFSGDALDTSEFTRSIDTLSSDISADLSDAIISINNHTDEAISSVHSYWVGVRSTDNATLNANMQSMITALENMDSHLGDQFTYTLETGNDGVNTLVITRKYSPTSP